MTSQYDFTNGEWDDIAVLPVLVGFAMAKAEDSGYFGSMREVRTLISSITTKVDDNRARSLIDAASGVQVRDRLEVFEGHAPDALADVAVRACTEIARLLQAKADGDEAAGYKAWVLSVAEDVAHAAKEQGIRVSALEAALLERLRIALDQT